MSDRINAFLPHPPTHTLYYYPWSILLLVDHWAVLHFVYLYVCVFLSSVPRSDNIQFRFEFNLLKIRHFIFRAYSSPHCCAYRWRIGENEHYHWKIMGKCAFKVKNFLIKLDSLPVCRDYYVEVIGLNVRVEKDKIKHSGHLQRLFEIYREGKEEQSIFWMRLFLMLHNSFLRSPKLLKSGTKYLHLKRLAFLSSWHEIWHLFWCTKESTARRVNTSAYKHSKFYGF